jgi:hypothetical protein
MTTGPANPAPSLAAQRSSPADNAHRDQRPAPPLAEDAVIEALVKIEVRLERRELARALFISSVRERPTVFQVRAAVREVLAEHGLRGCRRLYLRAERDTAQLDAIEPHEHHHQMHIDRLLWCLDQIDRAFRPRHRRRSRPQQPGLPLTEVLADEGW